MRFAGPFMFYRRRANNCSKKGEKKKMNEFRMMDEKFYLAMAILLCTVLQ